MTTELDVPIVNDDGEVLVTTEEGRLEALADACKVLVEFEDHKHTANRAREMFRLLAREGDPPYVAPTGVVLDIKLGKKGARQVNPAAIERHREALTPIKLGPREVECDKCHGTGVREVMPKVTDIDHKDNRPKIARAGIAPDTLLIPGADPTIVYEISEGEVPW